MLDSWNAMLLSDDVPMRQQWMATMLDNEIVMGQQCLVELVPLLPCNKLMWPGRRWNGSVLWAVMKGCDRVRCWYIVGVLVG